MQHQILLPHYVSEALCLLEEAGFEAHAVGGCIRDSLLGHEPHDWDITTSALPEETQAVFSAYHVVPTGLRHGTVSVWYPVSPSREASYEESLLEITTFRVDGTYSDGRRPDAVRFTRSLEEDLARRDFTINAMAYSPTRGLCDPFGGQADLQNGVIRCVGVPRRRFDEDGLRILRALRFSSVLGFPLDSPTRDAVYRMKSRLSHVSMERIGVEFRKLLCGYDVEAVLRGYPAVIAQFIPEILPCLGFEQHSPYHVYDVWEHIIHTVSSADPDPVSRLAALFHDIAKPECYTRGEDGRGHFFGHQQKGADMAARILRRLRMDNATVSSVCTLVKYHDLSIVDTEKAVRRWLGRLGREDFWKLLALNWADTLAHAPAAMERLGILQREETIARRIIEQGKCFSLKSMAISGDDLLALGVPRGQMIGKLLHALLREVMEERCSNERNALLDAARQMLLQGGAESL